jgi:SAM-dependent methyltransferase
MTAKTSRSGMAELDFLSISEEECERWDREWLSYFQHEGSRSHCLDYRAFQLPNLATISREKMWETLRIWVDGAAVVKRRVLEIGCGTGYLGKQIGQVAEFYLGLDYSRLALYIARLVSPSNCKYVFVGDKMIIMQYANSMDTMVGREFFIHQNWDNALVVMKLAHYLLRPGGIVCADFWLPHTLVARLASLVSASRYGSVVYPARHALDPRHPSCAFGYTERDVNELARTCGFEIVDTTDIKVSQRRLVRFVKPIATR